MTTYDVEYLVSYRRTVRVDAPDKDTAAERADEAVRMEIAEVNAVRLDVSYYGIEVARKDDDA